MEWVQTTGKTVEEAKEAALDQLGVDESEAEFEVVEEPKSGLFGRFKREAVVRARVLPKQPPPKHDRRDRRRRKDGARSGGGGNRNRGGDQNGSAKRGAGAKSRSGRGSGRNGTGKAGVQSADADLGAKAEPQAKTARGAKADARAKTDARAKADRGAEAAPAPKPSSEVAPAAAQMAAPTEPAAQLAAGAEGSVLVAADVRDDVGRDEEERAPMSTETVSAAEQAAIIQDFVEGLTEAFGVDATLRQEQVDDETLEVQVAADDPGLLIGPKGQTLTAIQELARTVLQRKATGTYEGWVRLDIGGYRTRRREALERFARNVAEQVLASGRQKVLEPMSPADRKVVHDTINDIDGVATSSEGVEPDRRVVIRPAD